MPRVGVGTVPTRRPAVPSCWISIATGLIWEQPESGYISTWTPTATTEYTQWVRPGGDESFLARDLNDNGVVDNGSELFGGATLMELEGNRHGARRLASNGFQALAQYDRVVLGGNRDGLITTSDAVWDQLLLWRDGNADGVSTSDEIVPLGDAVQTLGISPFKSKELDKAGNWLALWDWAVGLGGDKLPMVDVFFASP